MNMKTPAETINSRPRKANDCFAKLDDLAPDVRLFDEFWREGELALMFGASGTGKSVLAMQVADAIARGGCVEGFQMEAARRKVLYVDLVHSETQFKRRYVFYSPDSSKPKHYKFSERLWRERPLPSEELVTWIRKRVREEGIQIVVIDDLSAMKTTADGTRETLTLMRDLRELCNELGISILAIAGAEAGPGRIVNEGDLKRNRVLCDVADSVFGIGRHPSNRDTCIVQTRCRNARIAWTDRNAPICRVVRLESGLLGMTFDERFRPVLSEEEIALIRRVKTLRNRSVPYRMIAEELGITKSRASRLMSKWTKEIGEELAAEEELAVGGGQLAAEEELAVGGRQLAVASNVDQILPTANSQLPTDDPEEWEEAGFEKPDWLDEAAEEELAVGGRQLVVASNADRTLPTANSKLPAIPFAAGLRRRSVYDLKRVFNEYGKEMFVEKEYSDGKPQVWYEFDNKGHKHRWEHRGDGRSGKNLGPSPYL